MHYVLSPEVAGGLGEDTDIDTSTHPPIVRFLHYEFEGWLGDEILESFPCFIVTARLAQWLAASGATGFRFGDVRISKSTQFLEWHPERALPDFRRLIPTGRAGVDDVGLSADNRLVVSDRVLETLRRGQLLYCDIERA